MRKIGFQQLPVEYLGFVIVMAPIWVHNRPVRPAMASIDILLDSVMNSEIPLAAAATKSGNSGAGAAAAQSSPPRANLFY